MKIKQLDKIGFKEALTKAVEAATPLSRSRIVMLPEALGRVAAEDIVARRSLPPYDNSAMDGFAVRVCDAGKKVRIAATILAGDTVSPSLEAQSCYKIMTGARVPSDAEAVVPVENCPEVDETWVRLPEGIKREQNIRRAGEEQREGNVLIKKGTRLDPSRIAMLAAQGITAVKVYAPLRVAVASSGEEIVEPWDEAPNDRIYNANAFGIVAQLKKEGFEAEYVGTVPDQKEACFRFIASLKGYDVVLTTGGVSMGEADHMVEAFRRAGMKAPLFHGVNVKPGRPTMMGVMGDTFVMAMPGNPLTTMLNVQLLCLPVLWRLQGLKACYAPYVSVQNGAPFHFKNFRDNLVPGYLRDGRFFAVRDNKIGSGMLTPLMEADCAAVFEQGAHPPREGETIKVVLFDKTTGATAPDAFNAPDRG